MGGERDDLELVMKLKWARNVLLGKEIIYNIYA